MDLSDFSDPETQAQFKAFLEARQAAKNAKNSSATASATASTHPPALNGFRRIST